VAVGGRRDRFAKAYVAVWNGLGRSAPKLTWPFRTYVPGFAKTDVAGCSKVYMADARRSSHGSCDQTCQVRQSVRGSLAPTCRFRAVYVAHANVRGSQAYVAGLPQNRHGEDLPSRRDRPRMLFRGPVTSARNSHVGFGSLPRVFSSSVPSDTSFVGVS